MKYKQRDKTAIYPFTYSLCTPQQLNNAGTNKLRHTLAFIHQISFCAQSPCIESTENSWSWIFADQMTPNN